MKNFLILLMLIIAVWSFAAEDSKFPSNSTLQQISVQTNIPVKKIAQYLKLEDQTKYDLSIQELGLSNQDIQNAIKEYNTNKNSFFTGIALVGMGIVFTSLLLIGFIINSLQHIGERKKKEKISTPVGTVTAPLKHISSNGIVAAITAMLMHDEEERNKIELTWKRRSISMWKAAGMVENRVFEDRRGRQ